MRPILLGVIVAVLIPQTVWALRTRAPVVEPVIHEGIKYTAPNRDGRRGYVQALEVKTDRKLWEKTVFTNRIRPDLEEDVQWVFIQKLEIVGDKLVVTDERGRRYTTDFTEPAMPQDESDTKRSAGDPNAGLAGPILYLRTLETVAVILCAGAIVLFVVSRLLRKNSK